MNCCTDCFKDEELRKLIEQDSNTGDCDFCMSKSVPICSSAETADRLGEYLTSILELYQVAFGDEGEALGVALKRNWDIFSLNRNSIIALVEHYCPDLIRENPDILKLDVVIPEEFDSDFLLENGILCGNPWENFSKSIKTVNRFHYPFFNKKQFSSLLRRVTIFYDKEDEFFRGRIATETAGYKKDEMGSPPLGMATQGRANPDGISVLYVGSSEETILKEVRATTFDYVTIGTFYPKKELEVVNLSGLAKMSPFIFTNEVDIKKYYVNRLVFQDMVKDFARPLRRSDSPREYLSTQYISEFIKSEGYQGVRYDSTLNQGGWNLAVFDQELLECKNVQTYEITEIAYSKVKI